MLVGEDTIKAEEKQAGGGRGTKRIALSIVSKNNFIDGFFDRPLSRWFRGMSPLVFSLSHSFCRHSSCGLEGQMLDGPPFNSESHFPLYLSCSE